MNIPKLVYLLIKKLEDISHGEIALYENWLNSSTYRHNFCLHTFKGIYELNLKIYRLGNHKYSFIYNFLKILLLNSHCCF
jgi:hypothetical protein